MENGQYGSIATLTVGGANITNSGTVTKELSVDSTDAKITMSGTSVIEKFSVGSGSMVITSDAGATIKNAELSTDDFATGSSGTVRISNSLSLEGTGTFPLTFYVESNTKITKNTASSTWYVSYNGSIYQLPYVTFSDKTLSEVYSVTPSATTVALQDLTVQYAEGDITKESLTMTAGVGDMKCVIANIPTFIEIYNGEAKVAVNENILLGGPISTTLSIKAKVGNSAGDYTGYITLVKYAVCGTNDVKISEEDIQVTLKVNRKPGSGTIGVNDVYYGTPVTYTASSTTNDEGKTVEFKKRDAAGNTYSTELPTEAGEYTARATFAQTAIYEEYVITADFAILRREGTGSVTVDDIYYGEPINPDVTSATNGTDNVTFEYKEKDADDAAYTGTAPTLAGVYTIRATFAQTAGYNAVTATDDFTISRKTGSGTITVADIHYGESLNPVVASDANGTGSVTIEYKRKDALDDSYSTTKPEKVGEYTARATFAQTDEFLEATATDDFEIFRIEGTGTVTAEDIHYGETVSPVATSATNGTDNVTYEYKVKGAADTTYAQTAPTKVGVYTVRATFAQTDIYNAVTATDDFEILRNEGAGTVTVSDIHYGETISPVVTSATNGTENVTYEYKVKGAEDTTYTQTAPTKVGAYTVRATFAQTDIYNAVTATGDFEILKKAGTGTVTVETVYYGGTISPVVTSATNGTENVTYEYKVKGAEDTTYTQTAPTKVGAYTVRATFAQTDICSAVTATDDFEITYLKEPESPYSMSGKQGADGYYTSDVIITPAEGYLIAETLDGNYREKLTVSESADTFNIYLKKIATGEKTAAIQVTVIRIDMDSPAILNAGSGEKIYGEQVEVIIKDDNLARVLVNGEAVEFENHMAILQLSSNLGEETYEITCIDVAGNTSKTTVVVAADWMKDRMIPEGSAVRLSTEYSYQLGGGTWQVQGDGTSYAGGSTFYVTSEGEYTFTKID